MIPGGFLNLTETPGSSFVQSSTEIESPAIGAVRKIERKLCDDSGKPLIRVHPDRLVPFDTLTLSPPDKKKRVVVGHMLRLAADEVSVIKAHIVRTGAEAEYQKKVSAHTANPSSGKQEVVELCVFDLVDAAEGRVPLLHHDQQSLFARIQADHVRRNAARYVA